VRPSYNDLAEMIRLAGGTVLIDVPIESQLKETTNNRCLVIGAQNDLCILRPLIEKNIRKCLFN
jgi:hypothetical protein